MKTMKSTFARVAALLGMGALVGVGCIAEAPEDEAMDVGANEESSAIETMTIKIDNGVAHAAKLSESLLRVDIYDLQGNPQFSADFRLGAEGEETIQWIMFGAPGTEPVSKSMGPAMAELPELEIAIAGAVYIQKNVTNAMANGEAYDNYGCDLPYTWVTSCGSKGKCCDVHDACYAKYGCTAASWNTWQGANCEACNNNVVYCIFETNPGPSSCCAAGNCGRPR